MKKASLLMPATPVRQTSEKYSKRHHRCSSIHAEAPEQFQEGEMPGMPSS